MMNLILIYVVGYISSYILGRYLFKKIYSRRMEYDILYTNKDMVFNMAISIGSWMSVFVVITILIGDYLKNNKPKIIINISNWYFIWKNKESKF